MALTAIGSATATASIAAVLYSGRLAISNAERRSDGTIAAM